MATLLKKDKNYFDAVTPRSIYFILDQSIAMKNLYNNTNMMMNDVGGGDVSYESIRSMVGDVEYLTEGKDKNISRIDFAKDCIKFVINSCLSGNDYISLTTFNQHISRNLEHRSLQDNKDLVLNELDNVVKEGNCSGSCALYDALQNTLLAAYGNTSFSNFDSWVVMFTTGNDTSSTRTLEEMEAIMARININFIVVSLITDTRTVVAKRNQKCMQASKVVAKMALDVLDESDYEDYDVDQDDVCDDEDEDEDGDEEKQEEEEEEEEED